MESFACNRYKRLTMASRTLVCPGASARGHYTPRDIAIGDHADGFQVLLRFDYGNLAALVPGHDLGCRYTLCSSAQQEKLALMMSLACFMDLPLRIIRPFRLRGFRLLLIEIRISSVSGA
jgi:hypothetical protein